MQRAADAFKALITIPNIPTIFTIVLALATLTGVVTLPFEKTVIALLGLIAVSEVLQRTDVLQKLLVKSADIQHTISLFQKPTQLALRSSLNEGFTVFETYIHDAQEVFVCGLSLVHVRGSISTIEKGLKNGCTYRFVLVDPQLPQPAMAIIAEHDQRKVNADFFYTEIPQTILILNNAQTQAQPCKGNLEIRAAKGIPVFTITMVNPNSPTGRMRVEMRPYGRNLISSRPYFELRADNPNDKEWYEFFREQYFVKLWNASRLLPH